MFKQKEVTIGDTVYHLTQFPASKGIVYQKKIAKVALPVFAEIVKGDEGDNVFGKVIDRVWDNLDQLDEQFIKELVVTGATKGNMAIQFDIEFAGDYMRLFELVKEIVMFNFESVFIALGSVGQD